LQVQISKLEDDKRKFEQSVVTRNAEIDARSDAVARKSEQNRAREAKIFEREISVKEREISLQQAEESNRETTEKLRENAEQLRENVDAFEARYIELGQREADLDEREKKLHQAETAFTKQVTEADQRQGSLDRREREIAMQKIQLAEQEASLQQRQEKCEADEQKIAQNSQQISAALDMHNSVFEKLQTAFNTLLEKHTTILQRHDAVDSNSGGMLTEISTKVSDLSVLTGASVDKLVKSMEELASRIEAMPPGKREQDVQPGHCDDRSVSEAQLLSEDVVALRTEDLSGSVIQNDMQAQEFVRAPPPPPAAEEHRPVEGGVEASDEGNLPPPPPPPPAAEESRLVDVADETDEEASRFGSLEQIMNDLHTEMTLYKSFRSEDKLGRPFLIQREFMPMHMRSDINGVEWLAKQVIKQTKKHASHLQWAADFNEVEDELALTQSDIYVFDQIRSKQVGCERFVFDWLMCKFNHYGYISRPLGYRQYALKVTTGETRQYLLKTDELVNKLTSTAAVSSYATALSGDDVLAVQNYERMAVFPMSKREKFVSFMQTFPSKIPDAARSMQAVPARGREPEPAFRTFQNVPRSALAATAVQSSLLTARRLDPSSPAAGQYPAGNVRRPALGLARRSPAGQDSIGSARGDDSGPAARTVRKDSGPASGQ